MFFASQKESLVCICLCVCAPLLRVLFLSIPFIRDTARHCVPFLSLYTYYLHFFFVEALEIYSVNGQHCFVFSLLIK